MLNPEIRQLATNTPTSVNIASLAMAVRGQFQFPHEDAKASGKTEGSGAGYTGPALIVRCADRQGVMRCLDFALRHDLLIAMSNGQEEHAPWANCDHGIAIDLSALRKFSQESIPLEAEMDQ